MKRIFSIVTVFGIILFIGAFAVGLVTFYNKVIDPDISFRSKQHQEYDRPGYEPPVNRR